MSDHDHKPGVKDVNLVRRKLQLSGVSEQAAALLVVELGQLFGMDRVRFDASKSSLVFSYDATHCSLDRVEEKVRQHGASFDTGWWSRIKCSYYRFVDQNVKDNAAHEPHCCNRPPAGKR